jgi:GWxTD domain-containing protein
MKACFIRQCLIAGLLSGFAAACHAQPGDVRFSKDADLPDFYYDTPLMASPDSGKTRLKCYVKISYDELTFVREDDHFRARYELSVILLDPKGSQVEGKIRNLEVTVQHYDSTISRRAFSSSETRFDLRPGKTNLILSIMDFDSKKTGIKKIPLDIPERSASGLSASDLILSDRVEADSSGRLFPYASVLSDFPEAQDTLFLWFEIYAGPKTKIVPIQIQVCDLKGKVLRTEKADKLIESPNTVCVLPLVRGDLKGGKYKLEVLIGEGSAPIKRIKTFSVHWEGMPAQASDLDKAVDQMQHIAKRGEIKKLKKLQGDEKLAAFKEYWRGKDPTPGTEANELMEEYYRRVDYSNQNFGTFMEGWRTDRGMVFILLGPPNEVERHPFESGSRPYEIWTYDSVNRYFVFVDQTGLGDYRLATPFWDVMSQSR